MTNDEFNGVNQLFNELICDLDLNETMSVVDGESILSRCYKKVDKKIEDGILGCLILYNKHIIDDQYESAQKMKEYIINFY